MTNREIPAGRLEERFREKQALMTRAEAVHEASRCLYCYDAPCISSCPTAIDIPTFIRKIRTGNHRGSARTILSANLLGDSCARVCPVEVLCQSTCVYERWGRPAIEIGRLQRFAMYHGLAEESTSILERAPATGQSVALVGAGPASLACAGQLALLGHDPVIYEQDRYPGGLNATGVAPYKLQLDDELAEVAFIESLGVKIETGVSVGRDILPERLLADHAAVFLGIGLGRDARLGIPGETLNGVTGAVAWIRRLKTDPELDVSGVEQAVVVGGGNTAIDVARELRGLDVPNVTIVYRRRREDMSGYQHELGPGLDEGVGLIENSVVSSITGGGGRVVGLQVDSPGGSGRRLPAQLVVVAIGQSKLREVADWFDGVECDGRGRLVVDCATMATGHPRVFAGGDAINGGKEVVNAAHDGQLAARSIDALIRSSNGDQNV